MKNSNNYTLDRGQNEDAPIAKKKFRFSNFYHSIKSFSRSAKAFSVFIKGDGSKLPIAFVVIIIDSLSGVVTPYFIAKAVDQYIAVGNASGLTNIIYILAGIYLVTVFSGYAQSRLMGTVSQKTLYRLRDTLFKKIQELPIAFFNQNKAGDLMSRVNNDTDKLNQFLSESISRLVGTLSVVVGIGVFVFFINIKMAIAMISMVVFLVVITQALSGWVERKSKKNLQTTGNFSASLQENLTNFRVIVAYDKREYFKNHLNNGNQKAFESAKGAAIAGRIFEPIYDLASSLALIIVLVYGIHLISLGEITIGILIAFISYTLTFYDPLRTLAIIFGSIQTSVAAWSRISEILNLKDNLILVERESGQGDSRIGRGKKRGTDDQAHVGAPVESSTLGEYRSTPNLRLELKNVSFSYEEGGPVLEQVNLQFEPGKTYALVGPTGGGKSTLASLMSRLYDPTEGTIFLNGHDIRTYTKQERANLTSVILQEPLLFTGTVADNIRYGNDSLENKSEDEIKSMLEAKGFESVIERFENGLHTKIKEGTGAQLSLGQKQLISFMRTILREPKLLILDEATANIDTITEGILEKALQALPEDTTKIIIAHRLNTIREADQIMFVNGHHVTLAESLEESIHLIEHSKRKS